MVLDLAAGQVYFGLRQVGAGIGNLCIEALEFGAQGIDLLALAFEIGLGLVHLGAGHMAFRRESGDPLFGNEARLAQGLGAVEVELRAVEGGLVGGHLGLAGGNQAALLGQPALRLQPFRFASGQRGAGAGHGQFEIGDFQAHQQVTLADMLVVFHPHFIDARAELAGNAGDLALYIGVVGALEEAPLEVPMGEEGEGDQRDQGDEDQQATFELGGHEDYGSRSVSKFNRRNRHRHK